MQTIPVPPPRIALALAMLALMGISLVPPPGTTQAATASLTVSAIGDIGISLDAERNVDLAVARGAKGLLGLGDYNYDASLRGWDAMVQPLSSHGAWLARGNHDSLTAFRDRMPGGQPSWSILLSDVRLIALDTEQSMDVGSQQYQWLTGELAREPASTQKVLVMHRGWWLGLGARHPGTEFPGSAAAMDALIVTHGVDMVLAAHEHNYQRTHRNNIPYLIVGTGGRSIYPIAGSDPNTVATCACIGNLLLTLSANQLSARFVDVGGVERDAVNTDPAPTSSSSSPTGTPFSATFKNVRGNRYWVETELTANKALAGVEVRVNGGTWNTMTKQSWGSWARSMTVNDGSQVQFRALATSGESVLSSTYPWPPPSTTTSPSTTTTASTTTSTTTAGTSSTSVFMVTFKNVRGNEWWVEAEVQANHGLAGVDARKNGGAWVPLVKRSWGSWAETMHAPPGTIIEFRATSTHGDTLQSASYTWPPA